jgi:hypothetical protein
MDKQERIFQELLHERAAIWYISDKSGAKIMVKVPSSSIKALLKGCRIEFVYGRDEYQNSYIFHTGVRIYDDPLHYQSIFCAQRFLDEHLSLAKIMHLDQVEIQFYNEINVCQAYGTLRLRVQDRHDVHALQGNTKLLHKGDFDNLLSQSLDNFQFSLDNNSLFTSAPKLIETLVINGIIHNWQIVQNTFFGINEDAVIKISDSFEGKILELEAMVLMESLFGKSIWRSPQIFNKGQQRELIDILAYSEYGIFLIEAKALGIIDSAEDVSMGRKVANLKRHIAKAIRQLVGATKSITSNLPIYSQDKNEILFNRTLLLHGIVLVSDLLPFGNWDETIKALSEAMPKSKIYIHVMDMSEFARFIGYSKGDKNKFDYFLIKRIESFVENPSLAIRIDFVNDNNPKSQM